MAAPSSPGPPRSPQPVSPERRPGGERPSRGWGPGLARSVGGAVADARDALARVLLRLGLTPDAATVAGTLCALAGGACLALGAGHAVPWGPAPEGVARSAWPAAAAACLLLAGAMDMLDGALARLAGGGTRAGAFLDSTADRVAELALFAGCAVHFAAAGNATLVALCFLATGAAYLTSYAKARAENLGPGGGGGYWQRGERHAFACLGVLTGHVPAALWLLALAPWTTVARRLRSALRGLSGRAPDDGGGAFARGTRGYDALCVAFGVLVLVAPWLHPLLRGAGDPVGEWLRAAGR